jgi:dimethylargininase
MAGSKAALVRGVPESFDRALTSDPRARLDVKLARAQHDAYRAHLEASGYRLVTVPPDPQHPDCVFVEDTAVVIGDNAVATRPGPASRRAEVGPVAAVLGEWFTMHTIEAPATLDGGDVIVTSHRVLIGRSSRTNADGVTQLARIVAELGRQPVEVAVEEGLHLKSAVLPLDEETAVVTRGAVSESALVGYRLIYEDETERFRFSALPLSETKVLVTASAPRTAAMITEQGYAAIPIDISQIQAADGGLTCMSVVFDIP